MLRGFLRPRPYLSFALTSFQEIRRNQLFHFYQYQHHEPYRTIQIQLVLDQMFAKIRQVLLAKQFHRHLCQTRLQHMAQSFKKTTKWQKIGKK